MVEAAAAYRSRGLDFGAHAVAITQDGSALDRQARDQRFVERFPMWDLVGGRTSVTSAVGLLPAALQGIDVDALLAGAAAMDEATRRRETRRYPAALLALAWHAIGEGRGSKAMVVLPYNRLLLFSRYLQQLVMAAVEGLGNVVLETMTLGVPVVASAVGGIPELVIHGETGYLFSPGDMHVAREYILRLSQDSELARAMGRRGAEVVCERFTLAATVNRHIELYQSLLRKPPSGISE